MLNQYGHIETWEENYIPGTNLGLISGTYVLENEGATLKMIVVAGAGEYLYSVSISGRNLTLTSPAGVIDSYKKK